MSNLIKRHLHELRGTQEDYKLLLEQIGDVRIVLLGEASHGTHEFYEYRAEITKRLIQEKGFTLVAIEGDWPDTYRVNRYIQASNGDNLGIDALSDFKRFPAWMWRNTTVLNFITWLKAHNDTLSNNMPKVGFYGLDVYSLHKSMNAVIEYLDKVDPEAAYHARQRYSCFDHVAEDPQTYGYLASLHPKASCKNQAISQLIELRHHELEYLKRNGFPAQDAFFSAEQNARIVKNAEHYYRSLFANDTSSWNIRDIHMIETLEALLGHAASQYANPKVVIWAHNSHLGDARATQMAQQGELNLGQLVRERYGSDSFSLGFTTYSGTVSAASYWGGIVERKRVRPALKESYEAVFHHIEIPQFLLLFKNNPELSQALSKQRLERAIGVIYHPETERASHYFYAVLPEQFDALIHIDETHAVQPLEITNEWEKGELPETFPSGL